MKKNYGMLTTILLSTVANFRAFNNNGWKMEGDKIAVKDGNPIYVDTTGAEVTVDVTALSRLRAEARDHRTAKETAEAQLAKFKGIDDPEIARKAIETVAKLDAKKLIDAGEVDKLTDQIKQQFTAQVGELQSANKTLNDRYNELRVANVFAQSEFIRDRIALPRDIFESYFKGNFKFDDKGELAAYDRHGNLLLSKKEIGARASYEEALELLVEAHPQKDIILKANSANGTGNQGGGGTKGGGRVMKRAEFDKLSMKEQAAIGRQQATGEIQIVD